MLFRRLSTTLALFGVSCSIGCSAFMPRQEVVSIAATEPGATIYIDNAPVGPSPVRVSLDRDRTYSVLARQGDSIGSGAIGRRVSPTGIADIVGGFFFLVPFIGCFTPGFWELDPTTLTITMSGPAHAH
jgi:hypothetical protein